MQRVKTVLCEDIQYVFIMILTVNYTNPSSKAFYHREQIYCTCRDMPCLLLNKIAWFTVHEHSLVHVNVLLNVLKEYLEVRPSFTYPLLF